MFFDHYNIFLTKNNIIIYKKKALGPLNMIRGRIEFKISGKFPHQKNSRYWDAGHAVFEVMAL